MQDKSLQEVPPAVGILRLLSQSFFDFFALLYGQLLPILNVASTNECVGVSIAYLFGIVVCYLASRGRTFCSESEVV